ncbi:MAG: hypothetical protein IJU65_00420 [Desulfovibrio sp.]|nr:hypothetical protein [Desulfovibrio sp.]
MPDSMAYCAHAAVTLSSFCVGTALCVKDGAAMWKLVLGLLLAAVLVLLTASSAH